MTKYYVDNCTIYKLEDNNKHFAYYKSSNEWKKIFPKVSFDDLTKTSDDFEYIENITENLINHFKNLSSL